MFIQRGIHLRNWEARPARIASSPSESRLEAVPCGVFKTLAILSLSSKSYHGQLCRLTYCTILARGLGCRRKQADADFYRLRHDADSGRMRFRRRRRRHRGFRCRVRVRDQRREALFEFDAARNKSGTWTIYADCYRCSEHALEDVRSMTAR